MKICKSNLRKTRLAAAICLIALQFSCGENKKESLRLVELSPATTLDEETTEISSTPTPDSQLEKQVEVAGNPNLTPTPSQVIIPPTTTPCPGQSATACGPNSEYPNQPGQIVYPGQPQGDPCLPFYGIPGHVCSEPAVPCLQRFYDRTYICNPAIGDFPVNQTPAYVQPIDDDVPILDIDPTGITPYIASPEFLGPQELEESDPVQPTVNPVGELLPTTPISDPIGPITLIPNDPLSPTLAPIYTPTPTPGVEPF